MNTRPTLNVLLMGVLVVAVLASAVGIVYVKHLNRGYFIELGALGRTRNDLEVEWGKLTLERSTWAAHERIEEIAGKKLRLKMPPADAVILITH